MASISPSLKNAAFLSTQEPERFYFYESDITFYSELFSGTANELHHQEEVILARVTQREPRRSHIYTSVCVGWGGGGEKGG